MKETLSNSLRAIRLSNYYYALKAFIVTTLYGYNIIYLFIIHIECIFLALIYNVYDLFIGYNMAILEHINYKFFINKRLFKVTNKMDILICKTIAFLFL